MIKLDNMLLVGSAGSNAGKTQLACAVLRKFGKNHRITAIKVTTIRPSSDRCPRGGEGCGLCAEFKGDFDITRETDRHSHKDTTRLLAAGAFEVFWLRVKQSHLAQGLASLLAAVGRHLPCICESNSAREVIEPAVFLMTKNKGAGTWKDSARAIRGLADRIVSSDGKSFDLDLDSLQLHQSRWSLQETGPGAADHLGLLAETTAIIMAGGDSRRMGTDKALLPIDGLPMIEKIRRQLCGRFDQILISTNEPGTFDFLGLEVVTDRIAGQGPLMGIASALEASVNELNFVVACDIPLIDLALVRRMLQQAVESGADLVLPRPEAGRSEPLFAVYRKSALPTINRALAAGRRRIVEAFEADSVSYFDIAENERIINLNTMAEYEDFRKATDAQFQPGL